MAERLYSVRLGQFRKALLFESGCVFVLFVTVVSGDVTSIYHNFPSGWFLLWLLTIIGSVPLGIVMLIGSGWRSLPMAQRRATAMGYLLVGFIDLLALTIILEGQSAGTVIWLPVGLYALGLFVVYARVYAGAAIPKEQIFP